MLDLSELKTRRARLVREIAEDQERQRQQMEQVWASREQVEHNTGHSEMNLYELLEEAKALGLSPEEVTVESDTYWSYHDCFQVLKLNYRKDRTPEEVKKAREAWTPSVPQRLQQELDRTNSLILDRLGE